MTVAHSPRPAPTEPTSPPTARGPAAVIAIAVGAALAANLALWGIGLAAGGDFEFTNGDDVQSAAPGGVILLTAVPLTLGLALAAVLATRWSGAVRWAQVLGSAAAIVTIGGTLSTDFDGPSKLVLSLSHLTLVPVLVLALAALQRWAEERSAR